MKTQEIVLFCGSPTSNFLRTLKFSGIPVIHGLWFISGVDELCVDDEGQADVSAQRGGLHSTL